jgi:hypothetical protein
MIYGWMSERDFPVGVVHRNHQKQVGQQEADLKQRGDKQ